MPSISIIIPTHNRGELLMQTIASVQAQTNRDFECVVVDDHSTDDTASRMQAVLDTDSRFTMISVPSGRRGAQAARNIGIERAKGDYVMLLDSDDLLAPHCIEQRIAVMQSNPQLDFVVFPCECFIKQPGDVSLLWNVQTSEPDLDRFLKGDVPWQTTSPIWKRDAIVSLLPWPEDVPVAQDWEFHIRALARRMQYARFGSVDHYWRQAESERESIGKNSFKPELLRGRVGVNERVLKIIKDAGLLSDTYRDYLAGLFWQSAERVAQRVSRKEARLIWQKAHDLGLIKAAQLKQGRNYLLLARFARLHPHLLARLKRHWPASFFVTRSATYLKSPVPRQIESV
ncbi:MAG: glycosyltransferase family 2 protein [Burkholderiales bacterium]|nr:glycosyltransferase family 2 protein [Phycisphaerae bacterium]